MAGYGDHCLCRRPGECASGARTHAAWNPTARPITVTFSDGAKLTVPAGELKTARGGK
jgi:hypothetical protein